MTPATLPHRMPPAYTVSGATYGVMVARDLAGNQIASAMHSSDGWQVTVRQSTDTDRRTHLLFLGEETDALAVLHAVARELTS